MRCAPSAIIAGMPSLFGSRQREAADNLIVGAVAGDEPRPRRPAGVQALQLDFGDQDVGCAVDVERGCATSRGRARRVCAALTSSGSAPMPLTRT